MKNIYLFLFNGFSDWEISYCTPEIHKNQNFNLKIFSADGKPVHSIGGLNILPQLSLNDIVADDIDMLILPGGYDWEAKTLDFILPLVTTVNKQGKAIAAICGATIFLADNGFLNNVAHTSNDLDYLKFTAKNYKGENLYKKEAAVTHSNIITAGATSPIEFAKEIFKYINLSDNDTIEKWYQLYKNGIWSE